MRTFVFVLSLFLLPAPLIAAIPIENLVDLPVPIRPDGSLYTLDEVRAGIIRGSQTRLWSAEIAEENVIRAKLNVKNKHFAVVEIPFSESAYSIIYVSSENLDYNPTRETIHRNYAKWIYRLSTSINDQLLALVTEAEPAAASMEELFEDLLKLDDLRDRGILTDEEFDIEKGRLLEHN
jgi:hypothetical protein